jgi:tRNA threonylcarbamoyl adenosine modification protein YeaZ
MTAPVVPAAPDGLPRHRNGPWLALSVQATRTSAAIGTADGTFAHVVGNEASVTGPLAVGRDRPASRAALAVIAECLARSGHALHQLAGLCVASGPGAFTALRVAIGVMQGIGIATRLPVIPVPTLAALAVAAVTADLAEIDDEAARHVPAASPRLAAPRSHLVLTAIDARMHECYFAAWEVAFEPRMPIEARTPGAAVPETSPAWRLLGVFPALASAGGGVGSGEAALRVFERVIDTHGDRFAGLSLAGSGFDTEAALRRWSPQALGGRPVRSLPKLDVDAAAVLRAALVGDPSADGGWGPIAAAGLRPLYLRDKVALDVDEQRALAVRRDASSFRT